MFETGLFSVFTTSVIGFNLLSFLSPSVSQVKPLALHEISLENRQADRYVNEVFKDNILLNLAYLDGRVKKSSDINWDEVRKPFTYEFTLNPSETFAFHEDVLPKFAGKGLPADRQVVKTTNAHFNFDDGFKSDGFLFGDGVCHLASLINWVAKDAGLEVQAPVNHDFREIPEIPREFGTSIYYYPGQRFTNAQQNLYITNNFKNPVVFKFHYDGEKLKIEVF